MKRFLLEELVRVGRVDSIVCRVTLSLGPNKNIFPEVRSARHASSLQIVITIVLKKSTANSRDDGEYADHDQQDSPPRHSGMRLVILFFGLPVTLFISHRFIICTEIFSFLTNHFYCFGDMEAFLL